MRKHCSALTSKGQLTIPTFVRNKIHIPFGTKVEFIVHNGYIILIPITTSVRSLQKILPKPKNTLSCEEMDTFIKEAYDRT